MLRGDRSRVGAPLDGAQTKRPSPAMWLDREAQPTTAVPRHPRNARPRTVSNDHSPHHAEFAIGPSAISAYSRLSYKMWYALAEFVDNSTQSRTNYSHLIDDVLREEGTPLRVSIVHDRKQKTLEIEDNSIGMSLDTLEAALRVASPTPDSRGRSKYGLGLKTAACWLGRRWSITTCEWGSGVEWSATIDVDSIASGSCNIPIRQRVVPSDCHYTKILIEDLNRTIQQRTEQTTKVYLGSMYRIDIRRSGLLLLYNHDQVPLPEDHEFATDDSGTEMREPFETRIGGKRVHGWFGVLKAGSRKFAGFSLFQNDRQIRGYPDAWRPTAVFGGVEDEGGNSLVSQRLTGEIIVDGFDVSHTKDAILFRGTEEEELETYLAEATRRLKAFASAMRKGPRGTPWSKENVKSLLDEMKTEFGSAEMRDAVREAVLPPLALIKEANRKQVAGLTPEDMLWEIDLDPSFTVRVYLQDRTENDPHLTLSWAPSSGGESSDISVIINQRHPYYGLIDSRDRADELIRQFIYDAIAEYRAFQRRSHQEPDAIRKLKDQLLRTEMRRLENRHACAQQQELDVLYGDINGGASDSNE